MRSRRWLERGLALVPTLVVVLAPVLMVQEELELTRARRACPQLDCRWLEGSVAYDDY